MLTKLANLIGFKTKAQIANQYVSSHADWQSEHRQWMHNHGLSPLTFD